MPWLSALTPTTVFIAALLVSNVVAFAGWTTNTKRLEHTRQDLATCQVQHKVFVEQTRIAGEEAAKKAKVTEAENRRVADETSNAWAAAITAVRTDSARKLRLAPAHSSSREMPGIAEPRPSDVPASTDAIPSPERLAADCAETTVTANFLQHYIENLR